MTTPLVLLYAAAALFAFPRIARALARAMRVIDTEPIEMPEQFMCFFFGLFLSAAWPFPALFAIVRHAMFDEETS